MHGVDLTSALILLLAILLFDAFLVPRYENIGAAIASLVSFSSRYFTRCFPCMSISYCLSSHLR